jgi:hypothetical protein
MGNPFYRNFGIADAKFQKATTVTACTFTDSGDLVTASSHGLSDGWTVVLQTIVTTTGASVNVRYYVISSTSSTFQLAATVGGSAIALTTNGTGTYIAIKEYDVYLANSADINVKSKGFTYAGDDTELDRTQILGYTVKLSADCLPLATHMALFGLSAYAANLPATAISTTANTSLVYGGTLTERAGVACGLYFVGTATRVDATTGAETNVYVTRWFPVGTVSGVTPTGMKTGDKSDVESYEFTASKTSVDLAAGALPATVPSGGIFYATLEVAVP